MAAMSTTRIPPRSKADREAGLRRVGRITRWVATGGAAAVGLFAGLASHTATTATSTATRATSNTNASTATTSDDGTSSDSTSATSGQSTLSQSGPVQSSASSNTPVVVSGAS